jgi:hypothetical protein
VEKEEVMATTTTYYLYCSYDELYGKTTNLGEAVGWVIQLLLEGKEIRISVEKNTV